MHFKAANSSLLILLLLKHRLVSSHLGYLTNAIYHPRETSIDTKNHKNVLQEE